ncbi:hypothetical protein CFS9_03110 [Flavobacterium sp. CFS9]|uniref:Uncharacterized protein n=1 Tax=Flavobacterium sp. CFS9 TaxID=3143118 RepID=A0AAT9GWQ9_9FLAO
MKRAITVIVIFLLAFATSLLLDIDFIATNNVRYTLVVGFIAFEFVIGWNILKSISTQKKKNE